MRILLGALVTALVSVASASNIRSDGATLLVNEVPAYAFRTALDGLDPASRAGIAAAALGQASTEPIAVRSSGKTNFRVLAGTRVIAIVTPQEARAHGSEPRALAFAWASRVRNLLALPALKVGAANIRMPAGGATSVTLVGSRVHIASIASTDEQVVQADKVPGGMRITGVAPGDAQIVVEAGGFEARVSVAVRPVAAEFPQRLAGAVVGNPAGADAVRGAIQAALNTQLRGATGVRFKHALVTPTSIKPGEARTYAVQVRAEGGDTIGQTGQALVTVRNMGGGLTPEGKLWYCNDPENIRAVGPLFLAELRQGASARMLYHHINGTSQPLIVRVQAVNDSDTPAQLAIIPGDSTPDRNPVLAGVQAADQFWRAWLVGSGEVVEIPARSSLPISLRRLTPGDTISGLATLRLMGGPDMIRIRTDALPPFALDGPWREAANSSAPWRFTGAGPITAFDTSRVALSEHVYPNPFREEEVKYQVGGRFGFVRIGQSPIARQDEGKFLQGNFGVVYNIRADVENPTSRAADVEVVFEASAGYSGGLFVVDGNYIRTGLLQPKGETRLKRFRLEAGARRSVNIQTVPLSGSSYPITVVIRPLQSSVPGGL